MASNIKTFFSKPKNVFWTILILVLLTRFWNLNSSPGWFPDEGVDLNIAWNLLHGKAQLFSISYPFVPHPPLFFVTSFLPIIIFGKSILAVRFVSALCGVVNVYLVFLLAREIFGDWKKASLAALIYVFLPLEWGNTRYGISYELLLSFATAFLYHFFKFLRTKDDSSIGWASLFCGLASITSYLGLVLIPLVIFLAYLKAKRRIVWTVLVSCAPFVLYVLFVFSVMHLGREFFYDLRYSLTRPGGEGGGSGVIGYFGTLLGTSAFVLIGLPGIFLIKNNYRVIVPAVFLFLAIIEYKIKATTFFSYPFTAIGLSAVLFTVFGYIDSLPKKNRWLALAAGSLAAIALFVYPTAKVIKAIAVKGYFGFSQERFFAPNSLADSKDVANFINSKSTKDDVIMASPHFSSLLNSKTIDPVISTVYQGYDTVNFSANFPKERFVYNSSLFNVKYAVVDKFTTGWFAFQPNVREAVLEKFWNYWPVVYQKGEYKVYRNPFPIVAGNSSSPIGQPFFKYSPLETMKYLNFALGLDKVTFYKDSATEQDIAEIKRAYHLISEDDQKLVIDTGNSLKSAYISQAPFFFYNGNDREFYSLTKKANIDPQKNLTVDLSTAQANQKISIADQAAFTNHFVVSSDKDDYIKALALAKTTKEKIPFQANGIWNYSDYWKQTYNDDSIATSQSGALLMPFTIKESRNYKIIARVYQGGSNRGKVQVALDNKSLSNDIIDRNKPAGFYFKEIYSGSISSGQHSLRFDNDGSGSVDIDEVFLVSADDYSTAFAQISRDVESNKISIQNASALNISDKTQDEISYDLKTSGSHKKLSYQSSRPTVIAFPEAFDTNCRGKGNDGTNYTPIEVNGQYLGFIVKKTGAVTLDIDCQPS